MVGTNVLAAIGNTVSKIGFWGKQHSPQILVGVGLASGAACVALACVATAKSSEVVGEAQAELEAIDNTLSDPKIEKYTEEEAKKDRRKVYLHCGKKLAVMYAPAVGAGVTSVLCILGGTNILNKRNAAISAGLAASLSEFSDYRKRLIEKFGDEGEQIDKELRYGIKTIEEKETIVDENGKKKTVKTKKNVLDDKSVNCDGYSRVFDCRNPYWDKDPCYNMMFMRARQRMWNDKLNANGHVFLNEVLDSLGFPTTRIGQEVGWRIDPSDNTIDNYIDFGITEVRLGSEDGSSSNGIMLDFNVDGSILNKVDWPDQI